MVWRGGDPRPVPLIPAVAGLTAVGTLMDEEEDAEEKRRRMEAKIAAENFGEAVELADALGYDIVWQKRKDVK